MVKKRFGVILAIMLIVNCFGAVGSYAEEIRDNIALFSYSGGTAKAEMTEGNKTSGYPATGGTAKSSSLLFASISGTKNSAMSWSKDEYVYGGSSTAVVPRMEASTSDLWGDAPYFLIKTSTKGYENIRFSARVSGTKKGPRDFCLAYSTDNVTFKNIANSSVKLTGNMESTYANFLLPAEVENLDRVYIKIKIDGGETVSGMEITSDKDEYDSDITKYVYGSGNTDINSIELCATPIENKISVGAQTLEKGKTYNVYYESQTDEGSVIAAAYDANYRLISCRYNIDEFTVPENAAYIKIMLWDSIGKMHSLAEPVYKEVQ